jgi:uncharacterized protein
MLELRPNCECCDRDLPPESTDAVMCSFECTFCGGELVTRPRRPAEKLARYPASAERILKPQGCANAR